MRRRRADPSSVALEYAEVIEYAAEHYGDHEGVGAPRIARWLAQFPDQLRPVVGKALREISYYSASNIRAMTRQIVDSVYHGRRPEQRRRICFVPIGPPGGGSQVVARALRGMRDVPRGCVVTMADVERLPADGIEVFVLVEDFSGTGKTIRDWWSVVEQMFLPKNADLVLALLVMNHRARREVEAIFDEIISIADLGRAHDVFDELCERFSPKEKRGLLEACKATGCSE